MKASLHTLSFNSSIRKINFSSANSIQKQDKDPAEPLQQLELKRIVSFADNRAHENH